MPKITLNISEAAMPMAEARAKALGHASVEDWVKAIVTADFEQFQHEELVKTLDEAAAGPWLTAEEVRENMKQHLQMLREKASQAAR